jgi:sarcosine oxidase
VPLLVRAYELWRELEAHSGAALLHITGSVDAGPPGSAVFEGARASCAQYDLPHQILTSKELTARFPGYRLPAETMALLQPDGGFLSPELCVSNHVMLAEARGAEVHARERVLGWEPARGGVVVTTAHSRYEADRLIVSAGAWIADFVPSLNGKACPERQALAWFQPLRPELFRPEVFPVFNIFVPEGRYYGLPEYGIPGFKCGRYHHRNEQTHPDVMDRECHPEDEQILRDFASRYFPEGAGPTQSMYTCLFTNTTDEHFVIDLLPSYPQVVVASPCSGHGFKFASVVGEILSDLADTGESRHDTSLFRIGRFE